MKLGTNVEQEPPVWQTDTSSWNKHLSKVWTVGSGTLVELNHVWDCEIEFVLPTSQMCLLSNFIVSCLVTFQYTKTTD